jgi:hypothetical protein
MVAPVVLEVLMTNTEKDTELNLRQKLYDAHYNAANPIPTLDKVNALGVAIDNHIRAVVAGCKGESQRTDDAARQERDQAIREKDSYITALVAASTILRQERDEATNALSELTGAAHTTEAVIQVARRTLKASVRESMVDAVERVVDERDNALQMNAMASKDLAHHAAHLNSLRNLLSATSEETTDAAVRRVMARLEQLGTQLAGCGVAAQAAGRGGPGRVEPAEYGSYGWSASYGEVLKLRKNFEELLEIVKATAKATAWPGATAYDHVIRSMAFCQRFFSSPPATESDDGSMAAR